MRASWRQVSHKAGMEEVHLLQRMLAVKVKHLNSGIEVVAEQLFQKMQNGPGCWNDGSGSPAGLTGSCYFWHAWLIQRLPMTALPMPSSVPHCKLCGRGREVGAGGHERHEFHAGLRGLANLHPHIWQDISCTSSEGIYPIHYM